MTTAEEQLRTTAGRPFSAEHAARLRAGATIRIASVRRSTPPVGEGDVLEVAPPSSPARGDVVVCLAGHGYELRRLLRLTGAGWRARAEPGGDVIDLAGPALVGVVDAVEQGDVRVELRRGRWRAYGRLLAALPASAGSVARGLARVERLRHPLFPPLRMGAPASLMSRVRETYEREAAVLDAGDDLADAERIVLERWLRPGMRLLDVGAGTGREAIAFARGGLDVTGIDVSERMIDRARELVAAAGVSVTFDVAEPATYDPVREFDVVYLGTGIYNHIPTRARRVATLRQVTRRLDLGGFVVLAPVLFPPLPALSRARVVDGVRRLLRAAGVRDVAEPGDGYHRGLALAPVPQSFRYVHRFTRGTEIEAEIAAAGLVVLDRLDDAPVWKLGRPATARA